MSWSTDFSKLPKEGSVLVQRRGGGIYHYSVGLIKGHGLEHAEGLCAWHPEPEPFAPPKPEQIAKDSACWNLWRKEIIESIEQRTREIVAWEARYGGDK